MDYIGGLIYDVGKIVMASAFPAHFDEIYHHRAEEGVDLTASNGRSSAWIMPNWARCICASKGWRTRMPKSSNSITPRNRRASNRL